MTADSQYKRHDEATFVESFVILNAVGGECLEDFEQLRADAGLVELIGHEIPSPERIASISGMATFEYPSANVTAFLIMSTFKASNGMGRPVLGTVLGTWARKNGRHSADGFCSQVELERSGPLRRGGVFKNCGR